MNANINHTVFFKHLHLIDYQEAWNYQEQLFSEIISIKVGNRKQEPSLQKETPNFLLFCEHPHVFTLGKSGDAKNLLLSDQALNAKNAVYYKINRGGDITYHGPGQLVGYPILDLDNFFTDIHKYLRYLEEAIILTLRDYGIHGERYEGYTGVWLEPHAPHKARKICALGVKSSRWVTMHGFAFNVNTDLSYFDYIVPCGIEGKGVTSLARELGKEQDLEKVAEKVKGYIKELFGMELVAAGF